MQTEEVYTFEASIYKTGINYCVDVPLTISSKLKPVKGFIKVRGTINDFPFNKSLVPVKGSMYRLFVNIPMLRGGQTAVGEIACFTVAQDIEVVKREYPIPKSLIDQLRNGGLLDDFNGLTNSRRNEILKYLNSIKTEETLQKNIGKLLSQLKNKDRNIRIP